MTRVCRKRSVFSDLLQMFGPVGNAFLVKLTCKLKTKVFVENSRNEEFQYKFRKGPMLWEHTEPKNIFIYRVKRGGIVGFMYLWSCILANAKAKIYFNEGKLMVVQSKWQIPKIVKPLMTSRHCSSMAYCKGLSENWRGNFTIIIRLHRNLLKLEHKLPKRIAIKGSQIVKHWRCLDLRGPKIMKSSVTCLHKV